jgi:putative nucleotidyltransferase with HDIG domain
VVLLSLNVGLLTDLQMRYGLVSIIVGGLAVYLVSRVVQRAALLGAGALVMVIAAFTTFGVELFREAGVGVALRVSMWGLSQGLLAWVSTVLLLLILDLVFNLNTPLRLLELANPAQPLLKKLLQVAPGTYNHSILMGNLAEAAAESIGADPLLARVGAYYHDIGKTIRPEYFVENQIYVDNPHDRLSPNLSKLAIAAHVRDGEHLAKLHGLPAPVIDIIKQHHGTSVLAFFYHKAKEASLEPVDEESYRYEEEKPHSKEAAIIMLADGTEAAVRAMQHPTRRKIQGVIQEVFKQRIQDGQLDESDLTLGDLHKIQESFDTSLRGLVGHRIRYPEKNDQNERRAGRAANGEASPIDLPGGAVAHHPRLRVPPSAAALRTQRPAPPAEGPESGGASPGDG